MKKINLFVCGMDEGKMTTEQQLQNNKVAHVLEIGACKNKDCKMCNISVLLEEL